MSRGHSLQKILYEYTQDQVEAFYKAGLQNQRENVKQFCIASRIAQHAKPLEFKKYLNNSLDKEEKEKGKSSREKPSREDIIKLKEQLTHGKSTRNS